MRYSKLVLLLLFGHIALHAQDDHSVAGHDEHDSHHHHRNEIGVAIAPVYFVEESEFSYGLHLHYIHSLGESKFGLGAGYERIFDDHGHNTFGLIVGYRLHDRLNLMLAPGITLEDENPEVSPALHTELAYEFQINHIHIGPVLELAFDPEDVHISLGVHIGYGF